ncbi:MAG: hypothetical protein HYY37_03995 [Candidatus Aenigmarchaeota archaeon]|nr:hypothetical protein [Candidatus Aenigmarchaeota archaeon]
MFSDGATTTRINITNMGGWFTIDCFNPYGNKIGGYAAHSVGDAVAYVGRRSNGHKPDVHMTGFPSLHPLPVRLQWRGYPLG